MKSERYDTITMTTHVCADSVLYRVWIGDPEAGDFGDAREVWRREVPFGQRERFHAGGPAFVEAARAQAEYAETVARERLGEPT